MASTWTKYDALLASPYGGDRMVGMPATGGGLPPSYGGSWNRNYSAISELFTAIDERYMLLVYLNYNSGPPYSSKWEACRAYVASNALIGQRVHIELINAALEAIQVMCPHFFRSSGFSGPHPVWTWEALSSVVTSSENWSVSAGDRVLRRQLAYLKEMVDLLDVLVVTWGTAGDYSLQKSDILTGTYSTPAAAQEAALASADGESWSWEGPGTFAGSGVIASAEWDGDVWGVGDWIYPAGTITRGGMLCNKYAVAYPSASSHTIQKVELYWKRTSPNYIEVDDLERINKNSIYVYYYDYFVGATEVTDFSGNPKGAWGPFTCNDSATFREELTLGASPKDVAFKLSDFRSGEIAGNSYIIKGLEEGELDDTPDGWNWGYTYSPGGYVDGGRSYVHNLFGGGGVPVVLVTLDWLIHS